jgi:hypothetical protein
LQISQFSTDGRTPEQKVKDVEGIWNWVRDPKDKEGPETSPFKKFDEMIPQKPGQTPNDRANDIDTILTSPRSDSVDRTKAYSPAAFNKIANIPVPDGRTPEKKASVCGRHPEPDQKHQG